MIQPDYIFETSWEVCNRVGGIYAVLSTRAASMQKEHPDQVVFFGPDFAAHSDLYFLDAARQKSKTFLPAWLTRWADGRAETDIPVRIGRWNVPGQPLAILLRADSLWSKKNEIYGWAWQNFGVQSHAAYGDYDESCLFGYAAGMVMASLYDAIIGQRTKNIEQKTASLKDKKPNVVMHANEWQTAFAIFYIRYHRPAIGTLFTTHATGIGRSIAGNGKPLYDYFEGYNGDQMAAELNMVSKHSVEKMAAKWADCFTTVSDLTARECAQLLDKPVDIVTPNGFEPDFVPTGKLFDKKRAAARQALQHVASERLGGVVPENALMLCIAGRLEWKNKGIDVFLRAMQRLGEKMYQIVPTEREVVAFVMIPYLDRPVARIGKVSVVVVPYYLDGHDPMFGNQPNAIGGKGFSYYDLLIGMDATVFPSYYEPWGYTPLESVAFHVPTITTTLAGFGVWAEQCITHNAQCTMHNGLENGVEVINRTDSNYSEVVEQIADSLIHFLQLSPEQVADARKAAAAIAHKAEWRFFFKYYRQAYAIALKKAAKR
mgnify:FL=1